MSAVPLPLRFQVGARTLASIQRQLVRVPLSLDEALEGRLPVLPPLPRNAHGYAITSLPEGLRDQMALSAKGMIAFVRQHYQRHYIHLGGGFDAYEAGLTSNTRQSLRRKARRIAEVSSGDIDIRFYSKPEELLGFHDIARRISMRTYQEKLMGAGLPDSPEFLRKMYAMAADDSIRGWLLHIAGEPAAYLFCGGHGRTLRYDYVGHDPAFNDLSPGGVLQMAALRDLFTEGRFARFDFTEGEGQHKRQFATGEVACIDMLLLRSSLANRLTTLALGGFDRMAALGKKAADRPALKSLAKKVRRAS